MFAGVRTLSNQIKHAFIKSPKSSSSVGPLALPPAVGAEDPITHDTEPRFDQTAAERTPEKSHESGLQTAVKKVGSFFGLGHEFFFCLVNLRTQILLLMHVTGSSCPKKAHGVGSLEAHDAAVEAVTSCSGILETRHS